MGILIVMIIIVVTSAVILFLVKSGTIEVREVVMEPVLNAEFFPTGSKGYLVIEKFDFCNFVDDNFECWLLKDEFERTENVYVRFVVESTVYNGDVILLRNYQIKDPHGEIILELDQKNVYNFEMRSNEAVEPVVFADYFVMDNDAELGKYTLDVVVENPLLDKKVTWSKKFWLIEEEFLE